MKGVFLFIYILFTSIPIISQIKEEFRGVWITNIDSRVLETDEKIVEAMDFLATIGINVVFPVVYNKGYTLYPSDIFEGHFGVKTLPQPAYENRDFLERIVIEAHRNGIEVIPWFEFGFSSSYSQNGGHIIAKYPDWALNNSNGELVVRNGFDWMSAIHPEVQSYINSLIFEIIENYDIDGIQGDDRLPSMPVEGGYEEVTVQLYKSEHNGDDPPTSFTNPEWKKWRADKLSEYLHDLRDSIKIRNDNLILSSSPTPYYWGYDEYLQDSKTWAAQGLVDNIIPQLYQYNVGDYQFALNLITSQVRDENPEIFNAGVLAKSGEYVVDTTLLGNMVEANRNKNVNGECLFFYEALRANNNEVGDYLKRTFYSDSAILPYRNGTRYRPKADILNENEVDAIVKGNWSEYPMQGFEGKIFRSNERNLHSSVDYIMHAPEDAFYDVYVYMVPNTPWSDSAHYVVYSDSLMFDGSDSIETYLDQSNIDIKGWQNISTSYFRSGEHKVLRIDNKGLEEGEFIFTDAVMLMINRSIEPKIITSSANIANPIQFSGFNLLQNYPNPFNPTTKISFRIPQQEHVSLNLYDILGREVRTILTKELPMGKYEIEFNAENLSSGVYFYKIEAGFYTNSKKLILIR